MKLGHIFCALLGSSAIAGFAMACDPVEPRAVSGSFWENGYNRANFDVRLLPGETQRFEIAGKRAVVIGLTKSGKSTVKLLDRKGHALHFAALTSPAQPFRLAVCDQRIELASPAGKGDAICGSRS